MEDTKLLRKLRDWNLPDDDAMKMIFSNYIDIGGDLIGLTVENAVKAGKLLRQYDDQRRSNEVDREWRGKLEEIKSQLDHFYFYKQDDDDLKPIINTIDQILGFDSSNKE